MKTTDELTETVARAMHEGTRSRTIAPFDKCSEMTRDHWRNLARLAIEAIPDDAAGTAPPA